jgi:hypothetical protein
MEHRMENSSMIIIFIPFYSVSVICYTLIVSQYSDFWFSLMSHVNLQDVQVNSHSKGTGSSEKTEIQITIICVPAQRPNAL